MSTQSSASEAAASLAQNFEDSPKGWKQRLAMEFEAARKEAKPWQEEGRKIVDRFLDKRESGKDSMGGIRTRWNVYTAGIITKRAMLYGKVPQVDVRPKFADALDSAARIAGVMGERLLNADIEDPTDGYRDALRHCLQDWLNPGLGFLRLRYCPTYETQEAVPAKTKTDEATGEATELAPEVPAYDKLTHETVETLYVYWEDVLWSPSRTFQDVRWVGFGNDLSKEEFAQQFGDELAQAIAFNAKKDSGGGTDAKKADPWQRVRVWEVWDKEHKCVWYFCESHSEVLKRIDVDADEFNENGSQKDPLKLDGFWPFPEPLVANASTSAFQPKADWTLQRDVLEEMDNVAARLTDLRGAVKVIGVYDKSAVELARILSESTNSQMIPVPNWAAFAEKGGLKGAMDLLDLGPILAAIEALEGYWQQLNAIYMQLSGDSDLARGQQMENGTPGEAQVKARFASVRLQATKDRFAEFASDAQRIRLEIIAKHCSPQTIIQRSNIMHSMDAPEGMDGLQQILEAVELLKSDVSCYRIEVKSENLSMDDYAAIGAERDAVIANVAQFMTAAQPLAAMFPAAIPGLLRVLQWSLSARRGASEIEGVFDKLIAQAEAAASQPQGAPAQQGPDPKLLANQQKAQADLQKIQAQTQAEMMKAQNETQELAKRRIQDAQVTLQEQALKQRMHDQHAVNAPLMPGATQ